MAGLLAAPVGAAEVWSAICCRSVARADEAAVERLEEACAELNRLHRHHAVIEPWFSVQPGPPGRLVLLFGVRDPVDGLRREDFPRMLDGLRDHRLSDGSRPFAAAEWVPMTRVRSWRAANTAVDGP